MQKTKIGGNKMFIVGVNGSPNKEGNTAYLLNKILENINSQGADTTILNAGELLESCENKFCVACSSPCSGVCYEGTKLEEAFEILKKADGIILGSPVYFGTVSAQLKAFFDKTRKLRTNKELYNKVGAGVTVAASKYGGQETTIRAIHDILLVHGMMIIGDGYIDADCGHYGVCAHRPSDTDENADKRYQVLTKRMIEVCEDTMKLRQK